MNVIRDVFSMLIILCVLCLQFDSVQVQSSQNDQMRWISLVAPGGPGADKSNASSTVKAPQLQPLQERESNISVTLSKPKKEIKERSERAKKRKSKKLRKQHKESKSTVTSSTTKKEIEKRRESARKRKSNKLRNHHKESNHTDTLNTTKKEFEKKKERARKRKSDKHRGHHKESNRTDTLNTTKKEIKKKKESARKRKSEKLRKQHKYEESKFTVTLNTTKKENKKRREGARGRENEKLLRQLMELNPKTNTTRQENEEMRESAKKSESKRLSNQNKEPTKNMSRRKSEKRKKSARKRKSEKKIESKRKNEELRKQDKFPKSLEKMDPRKTRKDIRDSVERWFIPKVGGRQRKRPNSDTYQISNKDWKEIAEQKIEEGPPKYRKHFRPVNVETTPPWPKIRNKPNNRHNESEKTTPPWPKTRNKTNNRHNERVRTPIYMRQQDNGKKDNKENKDDDEDPEPEVLNIYSLREDMMTMLSSIPNINASVGVIGRTAEYNDIVLCKITGSTSKNKKPRKMRATADDDKYTDEEAEKKIVFIVHGLSAMGFKQVPCLYQEKQFKKLLQLYTEHLDKFDIYLIPIANPDGISGPMILRNKNNSPQTACSGVALDRNFDVSWNAFQVNSCHQQYPGPNAFSEPESRAVGDILHQFNHRIAAYINVHAGSYSNDVFKGDAVLYPKGFVEISSDDDKYMDIKGEIDEVMRNAGFKVMSVAVDTLYNWYGKVTGTSVDYASSVYGIPYAMEFVMQPYVDDPAAASSEKTSENVLTEIWKRVFDVVFMNIYRNNQNNEVNK